VVQWNKNLKRDGGAHNESPRRKTSKKNWGCYIMPTFCVKNRGGEATRDVLTGEKSGGPKNTNGTSGRKHRIAGKTGCRDQGTENAKRTEGIKKKPLWCKPPGGKGCERGRSICIKAGRHIKGSQLWPTPYYIRRRRGGSAESGRLNGEKKPAVRKRGTRCSPRSH